MDEIQEKEREEWPDDGACVIERALKTEGVAALLGRRHVSDDGVTWCGTDSFACPVDQARGQHRRPAPGHGDEHARRRRQRVAAHYERLAPGQPVGDRPGHELEDRRQPVRCSFDHADGYRRGPEHRRQKHR